MSPLLSSRIKMAGMFGAGCLLCGIAVRAGTTNVAVNLTNAIQYIKQVVVTSDGSAGGTVLVNLNSGGSSTFTNDITVGGTATIAKTGTLGSLQLGTTQGVNIISTNTGLDGTGASDTTLSTQKAVKEYIDNKKPTITKNALIAGTTNNDFCSNGTKTTIIVGTYSFVVCTSTATVDYDVCLLSKIDYLDNNDNSNFFECNVVFDTTLNKRSIEAKTIKTREGAATCKATCMKRY